MPPLQSSEALVVTLEKCWNGRNLLCPLHLLSYMHRCSLQSHPVLGNVFLSLDLDGGCTQSAVSVGGPLSSSYVPSWSLFKRNQSRDSLSSFLFTSTSRRECSEVQSSAREFVGLLKECAQLRDLDRGSSIHEHISSLELDKNNVFVGTALVDMYAKCGCLPKAREVFAKMNICNVVTWTAMISGYSEQGEDEEALCCFEHMCSAGIVPDSGTFVCALKGCGGMHNSTKGYELNGEIIFRGMECENIVGNALIDLYVRCGLLIDAQAVFDAHSARDLISWNTLLTGYAEHGPHEQVLRSFERMHAEHISPSGITFVCALKACSNLEAKEECRQIHGEVVALGLFDSDIFLVSMLVDVYSKFGSLAEAYQVLVGSDSRDVVSWNAMIGGYVEHDLNEEALGCLKEMEAEGILADTCTYIYILKACSCIGKIYAGCIIHGEIVKRGLENNLLICHPLMNMYANFGYVQAVQNLLDSVSIRNAFVWNSLLMAYTDLGDHRTVLILVKRMEEESTSPDFITLACSLVSCARLGLASEGQVLHSVLVKQGKENEFVVINALANMYLSCGLLIEAQDSFKRLTCRNVVLWTALIAGYAQMGESGIVFSMFNKMRNEGHCPDSVSFLMVLNACGRAGLVDEGESYFISHNAELSIILAVEHFTCIVDLYSRCGNMDKAIVIIGNMPFHPGLAVWNVMLWASQGCENVELAKVAFQEAVQLDDGDIGAYVSMSNIYAKYGGSTGMYHHL